MIKLTDVGLISHVLAILAYGILMVTALVRSRAGLNLWLAGAALASVAWAAAFVGALIFDADLEPWISRLQTVKIGTRLFKLPFADLIPIAPEDREALRSSIVASGGVSDPVLCWREHHGYGEDTARNRRQRMARDLRLATRDDPASESVRWS